MRMGSSKIAIFVSCGRYIFPNFRQETKIVMSEYIVLQRLYMTSKQMTLSSHFALNTVFRIESFSLDALVLRHDCFKIDGDAYILSAAKI